MEQLYIFIFAILFSSDLETIIRHRNEIKAEKKTISVILLYAGQVRD